MIRRGLTRLGTLALFLAVSMVVVLTAPSANADGYKLTDLGAVGSATGVSKDGVVVGQYGFGAGDTVSFIWRPTSPNAATGALQGIPDPLGVFCEAQGINDSLQVACGGDIQSIWSGGTIFTPLPDLVPHILDDVRQINNQGAVVGTGWRDVTILEPGNHAIFWPGGGQNPFVLDERTSDGYGLNDNGAFVGHVQDTDNTTIYHATLWGFLGLAVVSTTLNGDAGVDSNAFAVNDHGTVVGDINGAPVIWDSHGTQTNLPVLPGGGGRALAINSAGDVVGYSNTAAQVAVIWKNGSVTDLNTVTQLPAHWRLATATAINDAGQIVGTAVGPLGSSFPTLYSLAFLLTPDTTSPTTTGTLTPSAPNGTNGWYTVPVKLQFSASDPDDSSSSLQTMVKVDGGAAQNTNSVTVSQDGSHTVAYWSVDPSGNTETQKSVSFKIDSHAPTTTASVAGTAGSNGWLTGNGTVTLIATDALSGVARTTYTVDGGAPRTYAAPFALSANATHIVSFWSVDLAGNEESHGNITVQIDSTPPTVTFGAPSPAPNAAGWNNNPVDLPYSTADNLSGVASSVPAGPLHFGSAGQNQTQIVTVVDNAGNSATYTSPIVNIDTTPPVITVSANPSTLWSPDGKLVPVTISGTIRDALAGVDASSARFAVTDSYGAIEPSGPITLAVDGSFSFILPLEARRNGQDATGRVYSVAIRAIDRAGNPNSMPITVTVAHDQR